MKFPFDFSIALIFRLIFPGLVLALALLPLINFVLDTESISVPLSALIPTAVVAFGWLIVLLDQPIYMLYEGRRYWPSFLLKRMVGLQTASLVSSIKKSEALRSELATLAPPIKRSEALESELATLASFIKKIDALKSEHATLALSIKKSEALKSELATLATSIKRSEALKSEKKEVDLVKLDFPLGDDGQPKALYPTALGNLLTAYESYPGINYGIDAIFYWYRLWVVLDKDLREALDQAQALADSAIYVSFALLGSAVIFVGYAIFHVAVPRFALYSPPFEGSVAISVGLFAAMYFLYRLGLHQQRQYGELFKALFDQYRHKLSFATDAAWLAVRAGGGQPEAIQQPHLVASRFLRYHRIRPAGQTANVTPEDWKANSASRTP